MAKIQKIVCDRCGKEIASSYWSATKVSKFKMLFNVFYYSQNPTHYDYDLCNKCGDAITEFIEKKND